MRTFGKTRAMDAEDTTAQIIRSELARFKLLMSWTIRATIALAVISTFVLWASIDDLCVNRQSRDLRTDDDVGLAESLRSISSGLFRSLTGPRTVDINAMESRYRPICPEIDIPGSGKGIKPKLNETTLYHVEEFVLRSLTMDARSLTKDANQELQAMLKKRNGSSGRSTTTMSTTLNIGLDMDDYSLVPGGHWVPKKCLPRWKVAIVIPFRDRFYHLPILLSHLVPFLKLQCLEFAIFVIEQANELPFNRAMLMNVGFVEALNFQQFDCFIFHDVDHIPLRYRNYYGCGAMPRHFLSGVDRWKYKIIYELFFGAVTGFTRTQIRMMNGFPNAYWGWGGEDDDILKRINQKGMTWTRPKGDVGFYNVIQHHHRSSVKNEERWCLLEHSKQRNDGDGLNNLEYQVASVQLYPLYTNISVVIKPLPWQKQWHSCRKGKKASRKKKP